MDRCGAHMSVCTPCAQRRNGSVWRWFSAFRTRNP